MKYRQVLSRSRYLNLRKRIKDSLDETTSTDEAKEVINNYLEDNNPSMVLRAVVEVLSSVIDNLTKLSDSCKTKRKKVVKDSCKTKRKKVVKDSADEDTVLVCEDEDEIPDYYNDMIDALRQGNYVELQGTFAREVYNLVPPKFEKMVTLSNK